MVANPHHALPDGYPERLQDIADRIQMMPYGTTPHQFREYKSSLVRMILAMSEFPHSVS